MRIRFATLALALMLTTLPAWQANAWPSKPPMNLAETQLVHHKPWHKGGPPWLRRSHRGFGDLKGWERGRSSDEMGRRRWREERTFEERVERPRRSYRFDDDF
jgi:hypothetical protein